MAVNYTRVNWENLPSENTPISAGNLNKMDKGIDDLTTVVNSIEPNPVGVATEGLDKFGFDGIVYEIKGGHKIIQDGGTTLAQKDNMKFVGVYSDNTADDTEINIIRELDTDDIEDLSGEAKKGIIINTDETSDLPLTSDCVEYRNGQSVTQALDNALSDYEYSTTEKVVGKWIDGKPIYEKVVNFGALPNNTIKYVAHGISNLGFMVSMFGCAMDSSNSVIPIPEANKNAIYSVYIVVSGTNLAIETGVDRSGFTRTYIILRYTKTTD